jgi:hypothetical protein
MSPARPMVVMRLQAISTSSSASLIATCSPPMRRRTRSRVTIPRLATLVTTPTSAAAPPATTPATHTAVYTPTTDHTRTS